MTDTASGARELEGAISPEDPAYDEARQVFNAAVDRRPALIVRPADATGVARAIAYARERGLELAVRGAGHSNLGHGVVDGGLVLDTRQLRGLEIDVERRTAWAGAGLTAGEYTAEAGRVGLATGFGDAPGVGLAGLTLGGGIGWLVRKHGLTIDALRAVELVTADGQLLTADADRHPDLFWALRGGGGNFGVVTRLRFALEEVPVVLGGLLVLPARPDVLAGVLEAAAAADEALTAIVSAMPGPPAPFIPTEHQGRPVIMVMFAYAGDPEAGERALAPLRAGAAPIAEMARAMPYPELYSFAGGGPPRMAFAARSAFADAVDAEAVLARIAEPSGPRGAVQLRVLGGAAGRVPADATAFAHRDRPLMMVAFAMSERAGPQPELAAWTDATVAALGGTGAYVNWAGGPPREAVRAAYPGRTYERLAAVKRRYDPDNVFRANHNIEPAA